MSDWYAAKQERQIVAEHAARHPSGYLRTEAQHILAVFADGDQDRQLGLQPGNFITKMLEAAAVADSGNLARLYEGFPGYIQLVRMWKFEEGGSDRVRAIARGGSDD